MRDLLSKLDAIVSETALQDKSDLQAKRKALQDLQMNPVASNDPEIKQAIIQRKADLEKEAKAKGFTESFEIGDEFGISFSEDHEIATTIVDILEDGIVIELDDAAISMLTNEGLTFLEGEIVNEDKQKGVDGKACWKGYKRMGTKQKGGKTVDNCVKSEDLDEYFQFEFPKGKDRGPRDHGHDELERREKSFRKHELAKDGRDYKDAMSPKSKSPFKGKYNIAGPKGKLPEDSVAEGSAHGYNVARYYEKYNDQKKITNWLRKNAGLDKTAPVYFDDADLVYGDQTIVPDALVNPKYKMSDLLDAVKQAASSETEGLDMNLLKAAQGAMKSVKKDPESERNADKPYGYRDDGDKKPGRASSSDDGFNKSRYKLNAILDKDIDEAEYQGRKVQLGKKMAGDVKKSKVYVRNPKGNVVKVNFGDKKMKIKKSNPARRKSFRARHNCANPGPRHKARYWSCRSW